MSGVGCRVWSSERIQPKHGVFMHSVTLQEQIPAHLDLHVKCGTTCKHLVSSKYLAHHCKEERAFAETEQL